ncbi:serine/threonine-protein kinase PknK [Catenulispora sp. GAS73]|uniref:serine/threonine protein kinase n=1 Tax=Catenulispora sp. GAS73 TaxID=3156269 RepID=UPI003517B4B4
MTQRLGSRRTAPSPAPGDEAPAGYHDLEPVRHGATSTLFKAYSEHLGRQVALRIAATPAPTPVARRFAREAEALERLAQYANTAAPLDAGLTDRGLPYVAREYFADGSLLDLLETTGPLPLTDVLYIGVLTATALGSAHALGFLHQGVKPQNILRAADGGIALADFVIPALAPAPTQAEDPAHCAPEWLRGEPPSVATDVYSLGSTLFQLLAARPPYRPGGGVANLLLRMQSEEPPRLVRADVPPAVAAVVARAMAREPGERYQDAFTVAAALRAMQAELGLAEVDDPGWLPAGDPGAVEQGPETPGAAIMAIGPAAPDDPFERVAAQPEPAGMAGLLQTRGPALSGTSIAARRTNRRRWPTAVGVGAVAVAAVGAPLLFSRSANTTTAPSTSSTSAAAADPSGAAGAPAQSAPPSVAAPAAVVAVDAGATVNLRWTLPPGVELYPVLVQVMPASGARPAPLPLPAATGAYSVTSLDPGAGYCFQIGLLLRFGDAGHPPTEVWSTPACVRGAVAAGTAGATGAAGTSGAAGSGGR